MFRSRFVLPRVAGLGVNGVFAAEPISNLIGGLACYITMRCTVMRELEHRESMQRGQAKKNNFGFFRKTVDNSGKV